MNSDLFHPAVQSWFDKNFAAATEPQLRAWPAIKAGQHTLIAAPTGSGKTLAGFLSIIDDLVRHGLEHGLPDETFAVYVSPLKALSNDIQRNLQWPLRGIRDELLSLNLPDVDIQTMVRTGDTPQGERDRMRRRPPHIVVTTPESLYILLTSESGRKMLSTTRTVLVDEIHAIADDKRGAHLSLSLERLDALVGKKVTRVGISATQKPIDEIARFLTGGAACAIIDTGYVRQRDLAIEVPASPLEAVMSGEVWEQLYQRTAELVAEHRTTLIFVNTRRMAERVARHLSDLIGREHVTAHHGSMAKELRLDAEQRLKSGRLKALVATASLELGIDIGDVNLVCQFGSPRSIATLLQRVGRSGHAVKGIPKGRLFPLSRDDLVECAALLDSVYRDELDRIAIPQKPLDVLAQQIVAEVVCREWQEDELFALLRQAYPYRDLTREEFMDVLQMLVEGYGSKRGARRGYVYRDAVNKRLRGQRGARITAVMSGGTIPDTADYEVVLEPQAYKVGTVNEDFAVESLPGDIFQLGNTSYRIMRVESGRLRVEDAQGQPPSIPFWLGEAPGRTDELSYAVSRLRKRVSDRLTQATESAVIEALERESGLSHPAAEQLVAYLAATKTALGVVPTQEQIVFERFFDESGGMQLIIHSPYGSRVNRAWGLALRKRFCRKFNFELQAAASEDSIVLSLSTSHSFPLKEVARYLHVETLRDLLVQAVLAAPMFTARWRWNATVALALPRFRGGKKVPAPLQRMFAEDLIASVFPDQIACAENLVGDREVPDHPLVAQTMDDCLNDAMDVGGLERLLVRIEQGKVEIIARDVVEPSPFAAEILTARPYAYLDDAPLEERRTQAVMSRRWLDAESAEDIGRLDAEAIARVRAEAAPEARDPDELHQALLNTGFLSMLDIAPEWSGFLDTLYGDGRATQLEIDSAPIVIATERLPEWRALFPDARVEPEVVVPHEYARAWTREDALAEILRSRLSVTGPVKSIDLARTLMLDVGEVDIALTRLEVEGAVMRGSFTPDTKEGEWCDRALLARIHRYTVNRLRQEIEPVEARDFLRFLFSWQRVIPSARGEGPDALAAVLTHLEGFDAAALAWEADILPARLHDYDPAWLDDLCAKGRIAWTRLSLARAEPESARPATPVRVTPIALLPRRAAIIWETLAGKTAQEDSALSSRAQAVAQFLAQHGAAFFDEIVSATALLPTEVESALAELVARGAVNSDSFVGLRALLTPSDRRKPLAGHDRGNKRRRTALFGIEDAGRWSLLTRAISGERSMSPGRSPLPLGGGLGVRGISSGVTPGEGQGVRVIERSSVDNSIPSSPTPSTGSGQALLPGGEGSVVSLSPAESASHRIEHVARALLRRYGVVFWRLLEREAKWLPPWRDLLRVYHRLEARGEVRGGRFVSGFSGEQFALADAVTGLREIRRSARDDELVSVSGADPLNLVGVITPGAKVPAFATNRVLYRDGVPIATLISGVVNFLSPLGEKAEWEARKAVLRKEPSLLPSFLR